MSNLFWCADCGRYLNPKYYDQKCTEAHIKPEINSAAHKCEHGLHINCKKCNPYRCPCGRTVARNPYTIAGHLLTEYHRRNIRSKVSQKI